MEKKDRLIEAIVQKLLTEELKESSIPLELDTTEYLEHFFANPFPMSFNTCFGKVTIELPLANLARQVVDEMNARLVTLPIKFKDGEMELHFEEADGMKAGLDVFAEVAMTYFLYNVKPKAVFMLNLFFEESLSVALKTAQASYAKKLGDSEKRTPLEIDMRPLLNSFREREAAEDNERIARALRNFEGLKIISSKGRPRTWTKESLEKAVRRASFQVRKEKYRTPTLEDVARDLNKRNPDRARLTGKALGQMLTRYEINWKDIKNPHN